MNYLFFVFIFFQCIFCADIFEFHTEFGKCQLSNQGSTFNNNDLQKIIKEKIIKLSNNFNPTFAKREFSFIVDNNTMHVANPHWKWSLGITYYKPEKIIIKDPAVSHISKNTFQKVVEHELNHLMINRISSPGSIPRWFKEGIAMYYSDEISFNHKLKVAQVITNKDMFNTYDLITMHNLNQNEFQLAYAKSAIYVLSIKEIYGENALKTIINNLNQGQNFNKSFYNATSHSINEFNNILYEYIQNQYWWFQLINLPNKIFTFLPLLLVIGFILQSNKNKKIKERWEEEEELDPLEE